MIYILKGSEPSFISEKLDSLINEKNSEIIRFDGNDKSFSIYELVDSCNGNSLFNDSLCVIVKDPYFLIKKVDDNELSVLYDYISNPCFDTDLIFYTLDDKFNTRLKAFTNISQNCQIITFDGLDYKNFNNYCLSRLKEEGINMSRECSFYLSNICKRNASLFNQNLEILKLYPDEINVNVINKLCTSSDNNMVYDLINAICDKDLSKAISLERKLLNDNDSILGVIALLANNLRQTYHIGYLYEKGFRKSSIINECKIPEFLVNKSLEMLNKFDTMKILSLLNDLSILECKCKSANDLNNNNRFELYLINMMKKDNYASN